MALHDQYNDISVAYLAFNQFACIVSSHGIEKRHCITTYLLCLKKRPTLTDIIDSQQSMMIINVVVIIIHVNLYLKNIYNPHIDIQSHKQTMKRDMNHK